MIILSGIAFRIWMTCYGRTLAVWSGKWSFEEKTTNKKTQKWGQLLEYPHFGRSLMPNCWHHVNFWGSPKIFGMWKDGGIKIEHTQARRIILPDEQGNWPKRIFLETTPHLKIFTGSFFWGEGGVCGIVKHSGFRICMLKGYHRLLCHIVCRRFT